MLCKIVALKKSNMKQFNNFLSCLLIALSLIASSNAQEIQNADDKNGLRGLINDKQADTVGTLKVAVELGAEGVERAEELVGSFQSRRLALGELVVQDISSRGAPLLSAAAHDLGRLQRKVENSPHMFRGFNFPRNAGQNSISQVRSSIRGPAADVTSRNISTGIGVSLVDSDINTHLDAPAYTAPPVTTIGVQISAPAISVLADPSVVPSVISATLPNHGVATLPASTISSTLLPAGVSDSKSSGVLDIKTTATTINGSPATTSSVMIEQTTDPLKLVTSSEGSSEPSWLSSEPNLYDTSTANPIHVVTTTAFPYPPMLTPSISVDSSVSTDSELVISSHNTVDSENHIPQNNRATGVDQSNNSGVLQNSMIRLADGPLDTLNDNESTGSESSRPAPLTLVTNPVMEVYIDASSAIVSAGDTTVLSPLNIPSTTPLEPPPPQRPTAMPSWDSASSSDTFQETSFPQTAASISLDNNIFWEPATVVPGSSMPPHDDIPLNSVDTLLNISIFFEDNAVPDSNNNDENYSVLPNFPGTPSNDRLSRSPSTLISNPRVQGNDMYASISDMEVPSLSQIPHNTPVSNPRRIPNNDDVFSPNPTTLIQNPVTLIPNPTTLIPNRNPLLVPNRHPLVPNVSPFVPNVNPLVPNVNPFVPNMNPLVPNVTSLVPNINAFISNPRIQGNDMYSPNFDTPIPNLSTSIPNLSTSIPNLSTSIPNLSTSIPNLNTQGNDDIYLPNSNMMASSLSRIPGNNMFLPNSKKPTPNSSRIFIPNSNMDVPNSSKMIKNDTLFPDWDVNMPDPSFQIPFYSYLSSTYLQQDPFQNNVLSRMNENFLESAYDLMPNVYIEFLENQKNVEAPPPQSIRHNSYPFRDMILPNYFLEVGEDATTNNPAGAADLTSLTQSYYEQPEPLIQAKQVPLLRTSTGENSPFRFLDLSHQSHVNTNRAPTIKFLSKTLSSLPLLTNSVEKATSNEEILEGTHYTPQ